MQPLEATKRVARALARVIYRELSALNESKLTDSEQDWESDTALPAGQVIPTRGSSANSMYILGNPLCAHCQYYERRFLLAHGLLNALFWSNCRAG
jgi:hypothetical protein